MLVARHSTALNRSMRTAAATLHYTCAAAWCLVGQPGWLSQLSQVGPGFTPRRGWGRWADACQPVCHTLCCPGSGCPGGQHAPCPIPSHLPHSASPQPLGLHAWQPPRQHRQRVRQRGGGNGRPLRPPARCSWLECSTARTRTSPAHHPARPQPRPQSRRCAPPPTAAGTAPAAPQPSAQAALDRARWGRWGLAGRSVASPPWCGEPAPGVALHAHPLPSSHALVPHMCAVLAIQGHACLWDGAAIRQALCSLGAAAAAGAVNGLELHVEAGLHLVDFSSVQTRRKQYRRIVRVQLEAGLRCGRAAMGDRTILDAHARSVGQAMPDANM